MLYLQGIAVADPSPVFDALTGLLWGGTGLTTESGVALLAASVFTSAVTASIGVGGGLVMLAILANVLPAAVVIPVHGFIQLGSNAGRTYLFRRDVIWSLLVAFALGSVVGVALGAAVVVQLPESVLKAVLGIFILIATWRPRMGFGGGGGVWTFTLLGAAASFLAMFVGATGPFVAAALAPLKLSRHQLLATHGAMITLQHGLKVAAFALVGFAFGRWLPFLAAMLTAGFFGTWLGHQLVDRLPERTFRWVFRGLLTLLALRLLYAAAAPLWSAV